MTEIIETRELTELAERCEKARGPDAALNADILEALADERWRQLEYEASLPCGAPPDTVREEARYKAGLRFPFSASLDAAMTLVPEGWQVSEIGENWRAGGWHCTLAERPSEAQRRAFEAGKQYIVDSEHSNAATPALALCATALRARATQKLTTSGEG